MELKVALKELSKRISTLKENIKTEEATKNAFIMPFIRALGYDIFNPTEVIPEYVADIGKKKGEKVDYAILQDDEIVMLIECKHWAEDLDAHNTQLNRYFNATKTRFGLLTNGIKYILYTDIEETNKMDKKPFLEIDLENLKESTISALSKFHKENFNLESIIDSANVLKYSKEVREVLKNELEKPSQEFVKFFLSKIYSGVKTAKVITEFTEIIKKSTSLMLSDMINERLKSALDKELENQKDIQIEEEEEEEEDKIITTVEEIEGFHIVKSIIREVTSIDRISYKDTQSYFSIYIDNKRKYLCRLYFNNLKNKSIGIIDVKNGKKVEKFSIEKLDDIYQYAEQLKQSVKDYEEN